MHRIRMYISVQFSRSNCALAVLRANFHAKGSRDRKSLIKVTSVHSINYRFRKFYYSPSMHKLAVYRKLCVSVWKMAEPIQIFLQCRAFSTHFIRYAKFKNYIRFACIWKKFPSHSVTMHAIQCTKCCAKCTDDTMTYVSGVMVAHITRVISFIIHFALMSYRLKCMIHWAFRVVGWNIVSVNHTISAISFDTFI